MHAADAFDFYFFSMCGFVRQKNQRNTHPMLWNAIAMECNCNGMQLQWNAGPVKAEKIDHHFQTQNSACMCIDLIQPTDPMPTKGPPPVDMQLTIIGRFDPLHQNYYLSAPC
jgi:hypothetical protein